MADAFRELLVALANMSSRTVAITLLGGVTTIAAPFVWEASKAELPYWARFGVLHVLLVIAVFLAVLISSDRLRSLRNKPHPFQRRALMLIALIGALIGAIVAPIVWAIVPPDAAESEAAPDKKEKKPDDPTALVIRPGESIAAAANVLGPDPTRKPANADDLEFYFYSFWSAAGADYVQFADVTVTNRSPRKMHLELMGYWDYWKDSGEPGRSGTHAEWNPDGLKQHSGQEFIDLDAWETKRGRVVLFMGKPSKGEAGRWFVDSTEHVYLEVFDSVSGKQIAFRPAAGYPAGQMPSPLPSHKKLLALDLPELNSSEAQSASAPPKLDAIVRTRRMGYDKTKVNFGALFTNTSSAPVELAIRLIIRSIEDEQTWVAVQGLLTSGAKDATYSEKLSIGAGSTVEGGLSFDMAPLGVKGSGNSDWRLRNNPKWTLLEISDLNSGQTVWCALSSGYPPGVDMRPATIIANPPADSANLQLDETKDPQ